MFTSKPIGFVSSPYKDTSEIPKGLGAKHEADGVLKILLEFEPGLTDIEASRISSLSGVRSLSQTRIARRRPARHATL